ncbi:MAG: metalloregulator ArsR/SmtB family transcription factor [Pseudomonadota bacterium]
MNILPASLFASITHDTRLRSLLLLLEYDELCVCELTHAIGASQPHMSRHLSQLREAGLVTDRREGLWIHYRINPELPQWVTNILRETAEGVNGTAPFADDLTALKTMPNRPEAPRCA